MNKAHPADDEADKTAQTGRFERKLAEIKARLIAERGMPQTEEEEIQLELEACYEAVATTRL